MCGHRRPLRLVLINRGQVDWNHRQDFGWAPIVEACRNSHYDAAERLLNWNIVITEPDRDGDVPKDHATHPWIIGLLEDRLMFKDGGPLAFIKRACQREQGRGLATLFLIWSPTGAIRDNAGKQPIPRCQTVMYAVHEIEAKFWCACRSAAGRRLLTQRTARRTPGRGAWTMSRGGRASCAGPCSPACSTRLTPSCC